MSPATPDRILFLLKTRAPLSAAALAHELSITTMGVRQHLAKLVAEGLVRHSDQRHSVGRPKRQWHLTERGHARFPDNHAQVTVELLDGVRRLFGEDGLDRVIADRDSDMRERYRQALAAARSPGTRLRLLAKLRTAEGYMADARAEDEGFVFVENHCPICAAARACQGLCRSELELFQALLPGCTVERTEHLLAGARRCAYRVTPNAD
jgi:predicted ArsR family transcriptional regulator